MTKCLFRNALCLLGSRRMCASLSARGLEDIKALDLGIIIQCWLPRYIVAADLRICPSGQAVQFSRSHAALQGVSGRLGCLARPSLRVWRLKLPNFRVVSFDDA